MKLNMKEKVFKIRVYCTKCGEKIGESNPFSRKEMTSHWDTAVLTAPMCFICEKDSKVTPNLDIRFTIYRVDEDKEYDPKIYMPKADANKLLKVALEKYHKQK